MLNLQNKIYSFIRKHETIPSLTTVSHCCPNKILLGFQESLLESLNELTSVLSLRFQSQGGDSLTGTAWQFSLDKFS